MLCALERGSKAKPEVLIVGDSMQVIATDSRSLISVLYIGQMHMFKFGFENGSWFCFTSLFFVFPVDVGGPADPIAPSIIVPPKNTSVTMGRNEAIMECVANARYRFNTGANGCTRIEPLSKRLPSPPHFVIQMKLETFCLNMIENYFIRFSFCTSLFFSLIQGFLPSVTPILHNRCREF